MNSKQRKAMFAKNNEYLTKINKTANDKNIHGSDKVNNLKRLENERNAWLKYHQFKPKHDQRMKADKSYRTGTLLTETNSTAKQIKIYEQAKLTGKEKDSLVGHLLGRLESARARIENTEGIRYYK